MRNTADRQDKGNLIRRILILALIGGLAALMIRWATLQKIVDAGPDEYMRFIVSRFIYEHGKLPTGFDAEARDGNWGFSYAVYPFLASIVQALYMKIGSLFGTETRTILAAARMASVTFLTVAASFTFLAGRKLFGGWKGICFAVLVVFLPGFHYLGSYINCDSLALMAVSIILYAWVCALKDGWRWKTCIILAVGIGICALSYYNAYGWILASILYYFILAAAKREYTQKGMAPSSTGGGKNKYSREGSNPLLSMPPADRRRGQRNDAMHRPRRDKNAEAFLNEKAVFLKKTVLICLIVIGISAWFFIRNAYLYDGDFLGFRTARNLMEQYAIPALKPSVRQSPAEMGWSLRDLFWYRDPGWPHIWIKLAAVSFVGTFGYFNIFMKEIVNRIYIIFIGITLALGLVTVRRFSPVRKMEVTLQTVDDASLKTTDKDSQRTTDDVSKRTTDDVSKRTTDGNDRLSAYKKQSIRMLNPEGIFNLAMLLAMCIPVFLFVWYAYFSDLQAQGRYMISAVYAVMYFVICGCDFLLQKLHVRNTEIVYMILSGIWTAGALYNFFTVVLPAY